MLMSAGLFEATNDYLESAAKWSVVVDPPQDDASTTTTATALTTLMPVQRRTSASHSPTRPLPRCYTLQPTMLSSIGMHHHAASSPEQLSPEVARPSLQREGSGLLGRLTSWFSNTTTTTRSPSPQHIPPPTTRRTPPHGSSSSTSHPTAVTTSLPAHSAALLSMQAGGAGPSSLTQPSLSLFSPSPTSAPGVKTRNLATAATGVLLNLLEVGSCSHQKCLAFYDATALTAPTNTTAQLKLESFRRSRPTSFARLSSERWSDAQSPLQQQVQPLPSFPDVSEQAEEVLSEGDVSDEDDEAGPSKAIRRLGRKASTRAPSFVVAGASHAPGVASSTPPSQSAVAASATPPAPPPLMEDDDDEEDECFDTAGVAKSLLSTPAWLSRPLSKFILDLLMVLSSGNSPIRSSPATFVCALVLLERLQHRYLLSREVPPPTPPMMMEDGGPDSMMQRPSPQPSFRLAQSPQDKVREFLDDTPAVRLSVEALQQLTVTGHPHASRGPTTAASSSSVGPSSESDFSSALRSKSTSNQHLFPTSTSAAHHCASKGGAPNAGQPLRPVPLSALCRNCHMTPSNGLHLHAANIHLYFVAAVAVSMKVHEDTAHDGSAILLHLSRLMQCESLRGLWWAERCLCDALKYDFAVSTADYRVMLGQLAAHKDPAASESFLSMFAL